MTDEPRPRRCPAPPLRCRELGCGALDRRVHDVRSPNGWTHGRIQP